MIGKLKDLTINRDGSQNITVTVEADFRESFDELAGKDINVEIKKFSTRRSLNANSFLWHLCSEIAKKSSKFSTAGKEDVYREAIRAKGVWKEVYIRADAVDTFIRDWAEHGVGWFADIIDEFTGNKGTIYKQVHVYSGSSTYTSADLSPVIDYVVLQAEDLGIPTITPKELEKLLGKWTVKQQKKASA